MTSLTRNASQAYVLCRYLQDLCQRVGPQRYALSLVRLQHGAGTGFFGVGNTGSTDCAKERFRGLTDSLDQTNRSWRGIEFVSESCRGVDALDFRNRHRVEHTREVSHLFRSFETEFIISGQRFSANDLAVFVVRHQIVSLIEQSEQRRGWKFDEQDAPFSKYSSRIFYVATDVSEFTAAQLVAINDRRYSELLRSLRDYDFAALNDASRALLFGRGAHTLPSLDLAELYGEDRFELLLRHYRHKLSKRCDPTNSWHGADDMEKFLLWLVKRLST